MHIKTRKCAGGNVGSTVSVRKRGARLVLVVGILFGVDTGLGLALTSPEQLSLATDVYHHAAQVALQGGDFYDVTPPGLPGYYFLYPPVVMGPLLVYGLVDPGLAYAVQTVLNLATGVVLATVVVRIVERSGVELGRVDRLLVGAFCLLGAGAAVTLVLGQVNLLLALGIALGATWVERGRERRAGAVLAAVATVKLFPALVGAWLIRRRAWRTIAAATATGVGLALVGLVAFGPDATVVWATRTVPGEMSVGAFGGGPDPGAPYLGLRRQFSMVAPWIPDDLLLPASLLTVTPVVLASYRTFGSRVSRLVGLQATLLATLTVFPLEHFYLSIALFPTVALLYLIDAGAVDPGPARPLYLGGALVASVPMTLGGLHSALATLPLPAAVESAILGAVTPTFAFALPPTYGVWAMLAACVVYQHRAVSTPAPEDAVDPADD